MINLNSIKCVSCGKFMAIQSGVSWAQRWSYCMNGSPNLQDPIFQCKSCTEKHGKLTTNCAYPERYSGVYTDIVWVADETTN